VVNKIPNIKNTNSGNFFLIAGPCIIEDRNTTFQIAETLKSICDELEIPFIFKASFKKANRSRLDSYTGIGDAEALAILAEIKSKLNVPVLTDIHTVEDAEFAAKIADILQIPAFLCRQTDLLVAAAKTGKFVNIKKGQFMSAEAMKFAADKVINSGNKNVMITERGTSFGYQDLIVDFRAIPVMKSFCENVIVDITHSLQQPNQASGITGGKPELIETLAKAAIVTGADGIFLETHPEPQKSSSDGENMLKLEKVKSLLQKLVAIRKVVNSLEE
jgi:2-dehydro-3-deoxyphosphooctonate aldolase (KDO 8-P synthase)